MSRYAVFGRHAREQRCAEVDADTDNREALRLQEADGLDARNTRELRHVRDLAGPRRNGAETCENLAEPSRRQGQRLRYTQ